MTVRVPKGATMDMLASWGLARYQAAAAPLVDECRGMHEHEWSREARA